MKSDSQPTSRRLAIAVVVASAAGIVGAWQWSRASLLIGTPLVILSVVLLRWPDCIWAPAARVDLARRWQRWGLLGVCMVAVFFRCYRIEPPGLWGDDAINGLLAFDVLDGKIRSPLQLIDHSFSTFHALTNYIIAGSFLMFGPDPLSIRVPGIIANVLAVPAFYGIVSPLFGPRAALIATLFFASSPFEIGHAKGFLQNILGQSLEIAGLCLLVQGALRQRTWMLVAAALPIALAVYTYHAAKLVPLIAIVVAWQLLRAARARGIAVGRFLFATAAAFVLAVIPAIYGYAKHPDALTDRVSGTALWSTIRDTGNWWPLWDSFWKTLAVFHYQQGPIYHWFGIGTDAGVGIIVGCFVLHGLVQSLDRWRQPAHAFVLLWFAIALVPGLLSTEAPRGYRILNAAPVVFIWAALPLARLVSLRAVSGSMRLARCAALLLVVAVPLVDFNYYFYRVYTSGVFRWFQAEPMVEMGRELRAYGPGWTGFIVADNFTRDYETIRFLARAWNLQLRDVPSLGDALPVQDAGDGALFMLMRTPFDSIMLMRSMYPRVAADIRREPEQRLSWFDGLWAGEPPQTPVSSAFFPVSRETAGSVRGLAANYIGADGAPLATRIDAQPLLRELNDLPPAAATAQQPISVAWRGSLLVPAAGTYTVRVETPGEVMVAIGSGLKLTSESRSTTATLARGLTPIVIVARAPAPIVFQLFWERQGEAESIIPADAFYRLPVYGLRAEYRTATGTQARVEPFPYHLFFAPPFEGRFSAHWSGRLNVPPPGEYRLSIESDRPVVLEIDHAADTGERRLNAGMHKLNVRIDDIEGPPRLRLFWQLPDKERELIPPEAFSPE